MALFIAKHVTVMPEITLDYAPRPDDEWLVKTIDPKKHLFFGVDVAIV
jgi:hypothetical protein